MKEAELSIEEIEERYDLTREEVDNHIDFIFSADTKYGVIYLLGLYDMLNLKALARMLGKSQSTIHKHLEDLMERGYLKIANTMKGKFYERSQLVLDIHSYQKQQFQDRDIDQELQDLRQMTDEEFLDRTIDKFDEEDGMSPQRALNFDTIFGNAVSTMSIISQASTAATGEIFYHLYLIYLLKQIKLGKPFKFKEKLVFLVEHEKYGAKIQEYLEKVGANLSDLDDDQKVDMLTNSLAERKYRPILQNYFNDTLTIEEIRSVMPISATDYTDFFFKVANIQQLVRLIELNFKYYRDLQDLKDEFDEENKGIPDDQLTTQIINTFIGPLGKL